MSWPSRVKIKWIANKIGEDHFANEYYEEKTSTNGIGKKRYVIYKGLNETTKVPPLFHAWLHYMSDEFPQKEKKGFDWERNYIPNLTGTKYAYSPQVEAESISLYHSWSPEDQIKEEKQ